MTRQRIFGSDVPFLDWFRRCKELPSYSSDCGIVATDVDFFVHRYLSSCQSKGTREAQAMMMVEVKTREGDVEFSQRDTLWKIHVLSKGFNADMCVRHFGVSVLRMVGVDPSETEMLAWGRFDKKGELHFRPITTVTTSFA